MKTSFTIDLFHLISYMRIIFFVLLEILYTHIYTLVIKKEKANKNFHQPKIQNENEAKMNLSKNFWLKKKLFDKC